MKKLLFFLLSVGTAHPSIVRMPSRSNTVPHAVAQAQSQASLQHLSMRHAAALDSSYPEEVNNTWRYWSMGLAGGGGVMFVGDGVGVEHRLPWPDVRLSIEKSWYLTNAFTAALDISMLTPTIRLGYLLGPHTRVSVGVGVWLLGLYGMYGLKRFSEYVDMLGRGVAMKSRQDIGITNVMKVTPSLSLDHFLSTNCFVRITASYDRILLLLNKRHMFSVQWPQLTVGLNFKF